MAKYESFEISKEKIRKNWERFQENENDLKDIPLITLDFNSINFNKSIITIPIITNQLAKTGIDNVETILLRNFPETSLNMIEVFPLYTIGDGFTGSFQERFTVGAKGFKVGDVFINNQDFKYWFNHIDQTNFLLKVFYTINIRRVTEVSDPNIFTDAVPTFINLSLKIINQRLYEEMNEKKE